MNTPRDVFLYLLSIITLVASAIGFGVLLFELVNVFVPDILADPYYSSLSYFDSMRSALAALVIILPVFLWVSWFLKKDISKFPEKRELKVRKWLLYLTLFVAALVIIGDLVALVKNFLEGELSRRFVLKVLAILFIAGSVFVHYIIELKNKKSPGWIKIFDFTVLGIVTAGVVLGFYVAGSPQSQRFVRLDERRINDLLQVQWQVVNYWQRKEKLPVDLVDLTDPIAGFIAPRDPQTNQPYEYHTLGDLKFEICGVFDTISNGNQGHQVAYRNMPVPIVPMKGGFEGEGTWFHEKGRYCFERSIDTDLYPPLKETKN